MAKKEPAMRLVIEIGDANNNGKTDLSGSLKVGSSLLVQPPVDVDFLSALGFVQSFFMAVVSRFKK